MANTPLIQGVVTITCKDINGNSVAKTFSSVRSVSFDYGDGTINIVDVTGSFYFPIVPLATLTYTVTASVPPTHTIVAT